MTALIPGPMTERAFVQLEGVEDAPGQSAVRVARVVSAGEEVTYRTVAGEKTLAPVVYIHGLGSEGRDILAVARQAGAPAVLVDLPGFGASAKPDRAYPVRRAAEAVLAVLDATGLAAPVWVGCSYGGHVALRAALDHAERVRTLVLVDSGGLDPAPDPALARAFDEGALAARSVDAVRVACDALVARRNRRTDRFRARRLRAHAAVDRAATYRAIARSALGALEDDAARRLAEIGVPAALVHGAGDLLVPAETARRAVERFARGTLWILAGTGHMPWLEAPDEVAAVVRHPASGDGLR